MGTSDLHCAGNWAYRDVKDTMLARKRFSFRWERQAEGQNDPGSRECSDRDVPRASLGDTEKVHSAPLRLGCRVGTSFWDLCLS